MNVVKKEKVWKFLVEFYLLFSFLLNSGKVFGLSFSFVFFSDGIVNIVWNV